MLVKTFQAVDMPAAIRMVKAEFGPDAMILSSKKDKRRGLLGLYSKPFFEVTAALDRTPRALPAPRTEKKPVENTAQEEFQKSMLAPLARELKDLRAKVETLSSREREKVRQQPPPVPDEMDIPRRKAAVEPLQRPVARTEAEELKKILLRSLEKPDAQAAGSEQRQKPAKAKVAATRQDILEMLAAELKENGVGAGEIRNLMKPVAVAAVSGEGEVSLRRILKESVQSAIHCTGPLKMKKDGPRIMALVGPTGVGKTTTIAKLAALAYKHGVPVALITIDTFRIGGVEQLRTYSSIMGVPLTVASTPSELADALAVHSDKRLIFIDTAGQSPNDQARLRELNSFLKIDPAIETHLCLSATTRDKELSQTIVKFGMLPVSRVIFTKLDESESFGCIVNVHMRDKFPISYLTNGQRVPEDIEVASSGKIADLVVREITS